jgi:hypothetical protein
MPPSASEEHGRHIPAQGFEQNRNRLWRILEIRVHDHDPRAPRLSETGKDSLLLADIAR